LECGFRMRIQETKIMRIHADADADPQHCVKGKGENQILIVKSKGKILKSRKRKL
jgi:hypothetical protein